MSLRAQINADALGNVTIRMEGGLDYESSTPLRKELETMLSENPNSIITLDMNSLDFVGSSGIGHFVETIKLFNKNRSRIMLSNVKTEFLKVFKLYNLDAMDVMIRKFETDETENLNVEFGNRKNTFQN